MSSRSFLGPADRCPTRADWPMQGPPAIGRTGNGARRWPDLAEQARQHTRELHELAGCITPDPIPNQVMLDRLAKLSSLLAKVVELASEVRRHVSAHQSEAQLLDPLDAFSDSIRAATEAINDLAYIIGRELLAQANEKDHLKLRSHKKALQDRQTLRRVSRTAENCLKDLRGHLDRLPQHLERLANS